MYKKYSDYIFIIVSTRSKTIQFSKSKFMVEIDVSFGQFLDMLRENTNVVVDSKQSIIGLIGDIIPNSGNTVGHLASCYKSQDGILYVSIETDPAFG